ncbi:MAG: hypothetical protein U0228_26255 [Myxococcaceae bacterium]
MLRLAAGLLLALFATSCATSQPAPTASRYPPRIKPLDQVLADAEQFPCVAGLHSIPATVVEVGVFGNVPYQSFSNGTTELNAYGDPGDLVGLETGLQAEDPAQQQCLLQFLSRQTLQPADGTRVLALSNSLAGPFLDQQPNLSIEITPRTAPDAYGAWWVSLERPEAIAEAKAPPEQIAQLSQPQAQWQPAPATYYRRPYRPHVTYRPYRPVGPRVYPPTFNRRGGLYIRIR